MNYKGHCQRKKGGLGSKQRNQIEYMHLQPNNKKSQIQQIPTTCL